MKLLTKKEALKLDKNKRYLLACSGGPDSMALFGMLLEENYDFDVAMVNYKTRKESDLEQEIVSKYCQKHCKTSIFLEKDVDFAGNFEQEARNYRYDFFAKLYDKNSYEAVLIAHNFDDHLETFLMQKERKNYPENYGLKFENYRQKMKIIRPILGYEKSWLTNYCDVNNIPYSIDKSNLDQRYKRNQIRHNIISKMSLDEKLKMGEEIVKLNSEIASLNKEFDTHIFDHTAEIFSKNIEVLQRFLFYFVKKHNKKIPNGKFKNLIECILKDKVNTIFTFDGYNLIYDFEGLTIVKDPIDKIDYCYTKDEFEKLFKTNLDENNIKIRPLIKFKKFILNGHTKKVSRFFIECKMPLSIRLIWPCVINEKGEIIYTPRYRKNYVFKSDAKLIFSTKSLQNLNIWE